MSADTVEVTEYSEAGDAKVEGLAAGQWRLTMDAFPNRQFWFDLNESAWAAYREAIVTGVAPDRTTEPNPPICGDRKTTTTNRGYRGKELARSVPRKMQSRRRCKTAGKKSCVKSAALSQGLFELSPNAAHQRGIWWLYARFYVRIGRGYLACLEHAVSRHSGSLHRCT